MAQLGQTTLSRVVESLDVRFGTKVSDRQDPSCWRRGDGLQGMLALAAATQHIDKDAALQQAQAAVEAAATAAAEHPAQQQPRQRFRESVSSDNDYSEGAFQPGARLPQRGAAAAAAAESEEEKKEKRWAPDDPFALFPEIDPVPHCCDHRGSKASRDLQ